jgi:hypothetical protein
LRLMADFRTIWAEFSVFSNDRRLISLVGRGCDASQKSVAARITVRILSVQLF